MGIIKLFQSLGDCDCSRELYHSEPIDFNTIHKGVTIDDSLTPEQQKLLDLMEAMGKHMSKERSEFILKLLEGEK